MAQVLSSIVPSANGIAAITGTLQQVVTLALPPGQWIVDGEGWINITSGTPAMQLVAAVLSLNALGSTIEPKFDEASNIITLAMSASTKATAGFALPVNSMYVISEANNTAILGIRADWTGTGTLNLYGMVTARRQDVPMYLPA
jgi:hypothetical protein